MTTVFKEQDRVERIALVEPDPFRGGGDIPVGARGTIVEVDEGDVAVEWDGGLGTRFYSAYGAGSYIQHIQDVHESH